MDHRGKTKIKQKIEKYSEPARELKKLRYMKVILIVIVAIGAVPKSLENGLEELEISGIIEIIKHYYGLSCEKSPGDLRRLAVIQLLVKDHQLTLL